LIDSITFLQRTVARALLPVLRDELGHLNIPEIIRRPRESEVRATCGKVFLAYVLFVLKAHNSMKIHA
jgi:hypothetical protein